MVSLEPCVFHVGRIDAHGGVAHDGLRARGGHYGVEALVVAVHHIALVLALNAVLLLGHDIIFEVIELGVLVPVDDLLVGECGLELGVPIDHAHSAVDVALVVEVHEYVDDPLRAGLVHGEGRAVPVAARSQAAQLLEDDAAVLVCPVPCMLDELVARQVGLLDALLGKLVHHLGLSGDGCVVGAGHPAGVLALHAGAAHENILNCVVEHVTHVEDTRHVGRRNHDGVGLTLVGLATEQFVVEPVLVPFRLNLFGVVLTC